MTEETIKKCPNCGSSHLWKLGIIPSITKGRRQRWKCAECGKVFF